jgi:hypothetical protein
VYSFKNSSKKGPELVIEEVVILNQNNRIQVKSKQRLSSDISGEIVLARTNDYIEDRGGVYLKSMNEESQIMKMAYTYLKPEPFCGFIFTAWVDSLVCEQAVGGTSRTTTVIPPSVVTIRYVGEELVEVKAGKFRASVYETKKIYDFQEGNGNGRTMVSTSYIVKDIGMVKNVIVFITKQRKIKKIRPNPEVELDIKKGLEDLKNGKDPSEIAFLNDTQLPNDTVSFLPGFDITKSMSTKELISFQIK